MDEDDGNFFGVVGLAKVNPRAFGRFVGAKHSRDPEEIIVLFFVEGEGGGEIGLEGEGGVRGGEGGGALGIEEGELGGDGVIFGGVSEGGDGGDGDGEACGSGVEGGDACGVDDADERGAKAWAGDLGEDAVDGDGIGVEEGGEGAGIFGGWGTVGFELEGVGLGGT